VKRIVWTEIAKADLRALEKPTAMRILSTLHRFAESGAGDVKTLQGGWEELRLRIGDYRLFFVYPQRKLSRFAVSSTAGKHTAKVRALWSSFRGGGACVPTI
jgi:mRNA-degrading endonuclease RelE of RelBE toxin-antitoxin system